MTNELATATELSKIHGLLDSHFHHMATRGNIQRIKIDGKYKFIVSEVAEYLKNHPVKKHKSKEQKPEDTDYEFANDNDIEGMTRDIRHLLSLLLEGQQIQVRGMLDMRNDLNALAKAWK
jgi:hypothetical protein